MRPGPSLAVIAGQHGMEPAGPGMLAAFLDDLDPTTVAGTLRAVPMANDEALRCGYECEVPPHLLARARKLGVTSGGCPWRANRQTCGRNLNRLWPGKRTGSLHERLVAAMWEHVVADAEYVVDFHCWTDAGPAGVISYSDAGIEFGRWFGVPWLHRYPLTDHPGLLGLAGMRAGKIVITVELAPQKRVAPAAVRTGWDGLVNLMRRLGMLPGEATPPSEQYLTLYRRGDSRKMTLPWDAVIVPTDPPGLHYHKGAPLAVAVNLDRPQTVRRIKAPCNGVVLSHPHAGVIPRGKPILSFYKARVLPPWKP